MDWISKIFTRDNITFVLALIGSLGTFFNGIKHFLASRVKFDVKIFDIRYSNGIAQIYLDVRNLSINPIAISSISIKVDQKLYPCDLLQKKIRYSGDILYMTPLFPLNIAPQTSQQYFLEFLDVPDICITSGTTFYLSFDTNHGMITKSVILPCKGRYLHIKHST